jgi:hypothetical protein
MWNKRKDSLLISVVATGRAVEAGYAILGAAGNKLGADPKAPRELPA